MNQSRCCANDSGSGRSRGTGTSGGACAAPAPRSRASARAASPATVGASKIARSGSSTPSASRARVATRVASRECPPSSKKLSSTPTRSTPSTSAQIPASTSSVGVRGATYASAAPESSGAGSARRSVLPCGVSGSASSTTTAAGTMYSGIRSRSHARSSAPVASEAAAYPTSAFAPEASSRTTTAASRTRGCDASTPSTSPGSTRKPRTLTCWSVRPTNSSVPPARHRTRSPERYSRAPGSPESGSGTKRSAVSSGRFRYPRATAGPPTYSSPATPTGTGLAYRSSRYTRRSPTGLPIGMTGASKSAGTA